jgi:predicted DNA-binding protein
MNNNLYQGRPIKTQLNCYVPVELVQRLNELSHQTRRNRSALVIEMLSAELQKVADAMQCIPPVFEAVATHEDD